MTSAGSNAANSRAIVLLSGGLDSATVLAVARSEGFECFCLTVEYGQRHRCEIDAARRIAAALGAHAHLVMPVDHRIAAASALTSGGGDVPKDRAESAMAADVPPTYVPARNLVMLALAGAWAETVKASSIWIGVNAIDGPGYPDCREAFIQSFERTLNLGTRAGVQDHPLAIRAPLQHLSKADIIRLGTRLGVNYALTHSCYDPDAHARACGHCDACIIRRRGFEIAGVPDPTRYAVDEPAPTHMDAPGAHGSSMVQP